MRLVVDTNVLVGELLRTAGRTRLGDQLCERKSLGHSVRQSIQALDSGRHPNLAKRQSHLKAHPPSHQLNAASACLLQLLNLIGIAFASLVVVLP